MTAARTPYHASGLLSSGREQVDVTHRRHFWWSYSLAWLPYAAGYVAIFLLVRGAAWPSAFLDSLINVVPAAVLGVAVVWLCGRLAWPQSNRVSFFILHSVVAVAYSLLWFVTLVVALSVQQGLARGDWLDTLFRGPFRGPVRSSAMTWQLFQGVLLYLVIAGIAYAVRSAGAVRELEARATRAEALRTAAELQALRARLDPHFLFNTLHSVTALVRYDTVAAETALGRFAEMLRYVLKTGRDRLDDVSVGEEWAFVQSYLALEHLRLGVRLRVLADIDPHSLDWPIPAFTLQPLVENAIRHALAPSADGGTLSIIVSAADDVLRLEVRDDGAGANLEAVNRACGIGLRLVRQRLEARYGTSASMTVCTAPDAGFSVVLHLPFSASVPRIPYGS